jgi:hypothetical protein
LKCLYQRKWDELEMSILVQPSVTQFKVVSGRSSKTYRALTSEPPAKSPSNELLEVLSMTELMRRSSPHRTIEVGSGSTHTRARTHARTHAHARRRKSLTHTREHKTPEMTNTRTGEQHVSPRLILLHVYHSPLGVLPSCPSLSIRHCRRCARPENLGRCTR